MSPDVKRAMRDHRPDVPGVYDADSPAAQATLRRILADGARSARSRRRRRGFVVLPVAAGLAVAIVAVAPSLNATPDVLARAAAALGDDDTILHFRTESRVRVSPAEIRAGRPDDRVDGRAEIWETDGGRQIRKLMPGAEVVEDWDARSAQAYSRERDELITLTEPDYFREKTRRRGLTQPGFTEGNVIGDLAALVERARRGDGDLRLVGETVVRGIPAYELRLDHPATAGQPAFGPQPHPDTVDARFSRTIYIDRERYLPVRTVERGPGAAVLSVTEFFDVERLPRTPRTEALLEMSPHPGAKPVTEGRF